MKKNFLWSICLLLALSLHPAAQEGAAAWKFILAAATPDQVVSIIIADDDGSRQIAKQHLSEILAACRQFEVLRNPETRSLPDVKGRLLICLRGSNLLAIELVDGHWFQSSYLSQGRVMTCILRDRKDVLFRLLRPIWK